MPTRSTLPRCPSCGSPLTIVEEGVQPSYDGHGWTERHDPKPFAACGACPAIFDGAIWHGLPTPERRTA